jgi:activator of HSP90 ATPase
MPLDLKFDIKFRVPPRIMFHALTNPMEISKYTQSKAEFSKEENGTFNFYDGSITGTNIQIIENSKLVQKWKFPNLPNEVDVTVNLNEKPGQECHVYIIVKNIPEKDNLNSSVDVKNIEKGFRQQIFEKIKNFMGYPINNDSSSEESD